MTLLLKNLTHHQLRLPQLGGLGRHGCFAGLLRQHEHFKPECLVPVKNPFTRALLAWRTGAYTAFAACAEPDIFIHCRAYFPAGYFCGGLCESAIYCVPALAGRSRPAAVFVLLPCTGSAGKGISLQKKPEVL